MEPECLDQDLTTRCAPFAVGHAIAHPPVTCGYPLMHLFGGRKKGCVQIVGECFYAKVCECLMFPSVARIRAQVGEAGQAYFLTFEFPINTSNTFVICAKAFVGVTAVNEQWMERNAP